MLNAITIFAANTGNGGADHGAADKFTQTDLWNNILVPVAAAVGVLFVLFGIINVVRQLASGKSTGAVKAGLMTIVGAAFLFNLSLIFNVLAAAGTLVKTAIESFSQLITGGG